MILSLNQKLSVILLILSLVLVNNVSAKSENSNSGKGNSDSSGKAVVGQVEEVKNNQITVDDKKNNKKIEAELGTAEVIVQDKRGSSNRGKGSAALKSINKADKVALISTDSADESSGSGKVRKITKVFVKEASAAAQTNRRAVQGVISSIDGSTITLTHQIHRNRVFTILTNSLTQIKLKGAENVGLSSLQVGQRIVAMGDVSEGGILAKRIHVIPGKATGINKRFPIATSSATPSSSASATPAATSTPEPSATAESSPTTEPTP